MCVLFLSLERLFLCTFRSLFLLLVSSMRHYTERILNIQCSVFCVLRILNERESTKEILQRTREERQNLAANFDQEQHQMIITQRRGRTTQFSVYIGIICVSLMFERREPRKEHFDRSNSLSCSLFRFIFTMRFLSVCQGIVVVLPILDRYTQMRKETGRFTHGVNWQSLVHFVHFDAFRYSRYPRWDKRRLIVGLEIVFLSDRVNGMNGKAKSSKVSRYEGLFPDSFIRSLISF